MGSLDAVGSLRGSLVQTAPLSLVNSWPIFISLSLNLGTWMRGTRSPLSEPTVLDGGEHKSTGKQGNTGKTKKSKQNDFGRLGVGQVDPAN